VYLELFYVVDNAQILQTYLEEELEEMDWFRQYRAWMIKLEAEDDQDSENFDPEKENSIYFSNHTSKFEHAHNANPNNNSNMHS
jgi:hypothetical protein